MTEQLRVRGAVERDAHQAPDPFHHRLLGIRRLARVPHVDRQHSQQARVVGRADGHRPEGPEAVRGGELTELAHLRERGVVLDVADDERLETRVVDVRGVIGLLGQSNVHLLDEGRRQRRRRDPLQLTGFVVVAGGSSPTPSPTNSSTASSSPCSVSGMGAPARIRSSTSVSAGPSVSIRRRSVTSRKLPTTPRTAGSCIWFVQVVSAHRHEPSAWQAAQFDRCALERAIGEGRDGARMPGRRSSGWIRSRIGRPSSVARLESEHHLHRRADVGDRRPSRRSTPTTSLECCTNARKRASLSASTSRARIRLRHELGDAPRDERGGDADDRGQRERLGAARRRRGRRPPAPRTAPRRARSCGPARDARARVARVPEVAHRRVQHRRREQEVGDRPERVERAPSM